MSSFRSVPQAEDGLVNRIRTVHVAKLCHLFEVAPSLAEEEELHSELPETIDYAAFMELLERYEHAEDTVPHLQEFLSLFDQQVRRTLYFFSIVYRQSKNRTHSCKQRSHLLAHCSSSPSRSRG